MLVLDKRAGIAITGERHDTDVVELAKAAGEWLMPAHRIDKVTSGLVLLAKSVEVHGPLTQQFRDQTVDKTYLAITRSVGLPERATIDLPLAAGRKNRVRVAAPRELIQYDDLGLRYFVHAHDVFEKHLPATSTFEKLREADCRSLLAVKPLSGRRHQIRVHLAWIGHPILGDPLFGTTTASRTYLHAWKLSFDATHEDGRRIEVEVAPPREFWSEINPEWPGVVR